MCAGKLGKRPIEKRNTLAFATGKERTEEL